MSQVALVYEDWFHESLATLSKQMPVWVLRSERNESAAKEIWAGIHGAHRGVTLFSHLTDFVELVESIELRHPDWTEIRLIGMPTSVFLKDTFEAFGASLEQIDENTISAIRT